MSKELIIGFGKSSAKLALLTVVSTIVGSAMKEASKDVLERLTQLIRLAKNNKSIIP